MMVKCLPWGLCLDRFSLGCGAHGPPMWQGLCAKGLAWRPLWAEPLSFEKLVVSIGPIILGDFGQAGPRTWPDFLPMGPVGEISGQGPGPFWKMMVSIGSII